MMNILIVYAHPEPLSLNGSLKNFMIRRLEDAGHKVQVSDLYAMNWKAAIDAADSLDAPGEGRFNITRASRQAFETGRQSEDIAREQKKLLWADTVILQFPLWWFSMPAILKGWVERVYAYGFAYGVGEHSESRWGDRYGEGTLAGKRAMLVVTAGDGSRTTARAASTGRSTIFCSPSITASCTTPASTSCRPMSCTGPTGPTRRATRVLCEELGRRLDALATTPPIPYRRRTAAHTTFRS
jgi:NAD(P)H dehydrogenase (quinone)